MERPGSKHKASCESTSLSLGLLTWELKLAWSFDASAFGTAARPRSPFGRRQTPDRCAPVALVEQIGPSGLLDFALQGELRMALVNQPSGHRKHPVVGEDRLGGGDRPHLVDESHPDEGVEAQTPDLADQLPTSILESSLERRSRRPVWPRGRLSGWPPGRTAPMGRRGACAHRIRSRRSPPGAAPRPRRHPWTRSARGRGSPAGSACSPGISDHRVRVTRRPVCHSVGRCRERNRPSSIRSRRT